MRKYFCLINGLTVCWTRSKVIKKQSDLHCSYILRFVYKYLILCCILIGYTILPPHDTGMLICYKSTETVDYLVILCNIGQFITIKIVILSVQQD